MENISQNSQYQTEHVLVDPDDAIPPDGCSCVVPLVFATNDNYVPYTGVAIQSIIENSRSQNFYHIYILHTGLSRRNIQRLESLKKDNLSVLCLNVADLIQSKDMKLFQNRHLTEECFYRIVIPEIFYFFPHVIYLDCDIIINTDIADIIPADMGDALICAVRNIVGPVSEIHLTEKLHLDPEKYVNSGVLVINISQWLQQNIVDRCIHILKTYPSEYLLYSDQEVINIACKEKIFYLDASWNFSWLMIYGDPVYTALCKSIVDQVGDNYHILHFTSNMKPWSLPELPHSYIFWKYARNTIFYEEIIKNNLPDNREINKKIADLKKQQKKLENELSDIKKSKSYLIGRTVTWLPRKFLGALKSFRN